MSEARLLLTTLKEVLYLIFPLELLPLISEYVRAKMHEWRLPDDVVENRIITKTQIQSRDRDDFIVHSSYDHEEGPCRLCIDCRVTRVTKNVDNILSWPNEIEIGMIIIDDWGDKDFRIVAFIRYDTLLLNGTSSVGAMGPMTAHFELKENECTRLVIQMEPVKEHSITTTFTNDNGESFSESLSHLTWKIFRPYVRLHGNASVELISE